MADKDAPEPKAHDARYQIGVDTTEAGIYTYINAPKDWMNDWGMTVDGVHVEHVDNDVDGCWLYRKQ